MGIHFLNLGLLLLLQVAFESIGYSQQQDSSYFQFTYANDYFTSSDWYYTQGVRVEYGSGRWTGFAAREGYTPTSLRNEKARPNDRPYAGLTYFGLRTTSLSSWLSGRLTTEYIAGFIGPASGGKQEQTYIHRETGNIIPQGWDDQIANDLLLNVNARYDIGLYSTRFINIEAGAEARLGTFRTRAGLNSSISIGLLESSPTQRRSAIIALRIQPQAYVAIYDATLLGGVFNDNSPYTIPYSAFAKTVGRFTVGLDGRLGRFGLSFEHTYTTREYAGAQPHAWGTASIRWFGSRKGTSHPGPWSMP